MRELKGQIGPKGGSYKSINGSGDGSHCHEMPSNEAYNKANNIDNPKRDILPSIKMDAKDHMQTASWGSSNNAVEYRAEQAKLIAGGNMKAAIQKDIDDITSKFGTKYNDAIEQMLEYAKEMGWW